MSPPEELLGTTPYDDSGPVSGPTYDFSALTNAIANVDLSAILTSNSPPGSSSAPVLRRNVSEAAAYRQPSASAALSVTGTILTLSQACAQCSPLSYVAGGLPPSHTYATEVILRVQKNPGPSGSQGYDATQRMYLSAIVLRLAHVEDFRIRQHPPSNIWIICSTRNSRPRSWSCCQRICRRMALAS